MAGEVSPWHKLLVFNELIFILSFYYFSIVSRSFLLSFPLSPIRALK